MIIESINFQMIFFKLKLKLILNFIKLVKIHAN